MNDQETVFADGLIFKIKDNQPDFVIGNISVKVEDFVKFLNDNAKNGWVNISVQRSKAGKVYSKLDTWEPKTPQADNIVTNSMIKTPTDETEDPGLPF
jgi:hypothetical protein